MSSVLSIALPVFAVIAAGLLAGRLKLASAEDAGALNRFVFRFAMPAALFGLMSGAAGLEARDGVLALAYGIPALAVIFGAYVLARRIFRLGAADAGAHAFASTIGNAVFLGLPIALAVEGWARPFVVLMLVEGILIIGVGAALMAPRDAAAAASPMIAARKFFMRPLMNPLVAAALAGFAIASVGVALPAPVRAFFDILGRAAGPAALFSMGLFLATHPMPAVKSVAGKIAAIAAVKMALLPALALALASLLGVGDPHYVAALALFTVTPVALASYVMASQYGHYVSESVAAIAVTAALSVATISGVLVAFG